MSGPELRHVGTDGMLRGIRYSVRKKLMLMVLTTTLVALIITGVGMVLYDLRVYHQSWVDDLFAQAELLGRSSAAALTFNDASVARENLSLLKFKPGIRSAAIYTAKGSLFATYARSDVANPKFPAVPEAEGYRVDGDQLLLFKGIEDKNEIHGTVYLRADYELVKRLQNFLVMLGAVMTISFLMAVLMTSRLQAAVTKPIAAITEVARQVMERRDFSLRARKTTDDEIGYLVDTFNDMLAEVGRRARELEESNRTLEHEMMERRSAEKALLEADRRKDEFLAILAHELRNPLAPLRNAVEILRTAGSDAGAMQSAREMMDRQLRQLVHLVNDLLDVSRITTGKMALKKERVELRGIVQNALEVAGPLIEARKHRLTLRLPPEPIYLSADATRLAQAFLNLLNNAAKFTDAGGSITFTAELKDSELIVTVADTGIGIGAEMLPVIFDMFAQVDRSLERAQTGLGVGLTLAKHLIELHGGTITADSEGLGRGSRFIVRLPAITASVRDTATPEGDVPTASATAKHRILLADDNDDFAISLAMLLRAVGHEVRVAHDGLQALEAAAAFKPDFAFLDIGLPKLNGYDLARRLRELPATRHSVLVAVTGWGQEDDRRRAREAGFNHHMVKPLEIHQIQALLADVLPSR